MRRRLIVKLNCLVLLFASVGCSYGLNTKYNEYKTVYRSNNNVHPFYFGNTTSSKIVTGYRVKTRTIGQTITTTSVQGGSTSTTNLGSFGNAYPFGPGSRRTTVIINPDGKETITTNNFGTSGNFPTINGQRVQTTYVKRTCYTINGVGNCSSTQEQSNDKVNVLTITTAELHVETIIWKLQKFQEFRNERFDICTCKNYADCNCANKITSYTITNPCYCLCLQEENHESQCLCNANIIELQIKTDKPLQGCLCYDTDKTKSHLKCSCQKIRNDDRYESKKYTSIEVEVKDTRRIENFQNEILRKLSREDRGYNYCYAQKFDTGLSCAKMEYTHNGVSDCLCLDDSVDPNYHIRCICSLYILQPKIKYEHGNLQGCRCVFESMYTSICKCNQYIQSGKSVTIQPKKINEIKPTYDYSKVVLLITYESSIATIIWKLQEFREFQNEVFIMCAYSDGELSLMDTTAICTTSKPCRCLCIGGSNRNCVCNSHILDIQIEGDEPLEGCLCYNTGGAGSSLKCSCRKIRSEEIYEGKKYTSIEVEVKDTSRIERFRDDIFVQFPPGDTGYDYCYGKQFSTGFSCATLSHTHNGVSDCLCLDDSIDPSFHIRCICNIYILQPKIKYENGNLQGCRCVFELMFSSICECNPYIQYDQPQKLITTTKTSYDYSKVVLVITRTLSIETIIWNLQQFQEFRNEIFDVCTYSHGEWNLINKRAIYTKSKPCSCLCIGDSDRKCVCNSNILEIQIQSDVTLQGCLCYNTGGAGSSLKCSCQNVVKQNTYDSRKYTSVEVEVQTTIRIENFRDVIFGKFSKEDKGFDLCYCEDFGIKCHCNQYMNTRNSLSQCLCLNDHLTAAFPVRCVCNQYVLQPKVIHATGNLQRCNCMFGQETICTCNADTSSGRGPKNLPYQYPNAEVYDLTPLGDIVIEELRSYFQERIEFRGEKFDTCYCIYDGKRLECNCDNPMSTGAYIYFNPGYCLCVDPERNLNQANCLCNPKILKRQFKFNVKLYSLKACLCVHNMRSNKALTCTCKDINANIINDHKYISTEVELPSQSMSMMQIRDIIIPKFQGMDKEYDRCDCYSGNTLLKGECELHYPVNGLAPCLCIKDQDKYINTCICNSYIFQLKIRYNPEINPLRACHCVPNIKPNQIYCKCWSHTPIEQPQIITTTSTTTTPRPIYYNYESMLFILPEKGLTLTILRQEFVTSIEFKDEQFNICTCVVKPDNKYQCSCTESTQIYTKEQPINCLCIHSYIKDSMEECLCNRHVLKPQITYSTQEIYLFECSCYSSGGNVNSLSCDSCRPKRPYNPDYGFVLLNIVKEVRIDIEILLDYFESAEEYRLERFGTCACTNPQEELPCSCIRNYYRYAKHNILNVLCIVYKTNLPKLSECLSSYNVLLADITYNTSLIELQECACDISPTKKTDPICKCKRKESFNPNYQILIEFMYEIQIKDVVKRFERHQVFRHEHFIQCTHSKGYLQCPSRGNKELFIYQNSYRCLCIKELNEKTGDQSKCLCSINVLKPSITYNSKKVQLQECTCNANDLKCVCNKKLSYNPYGILIEFHEVTIHISIIFRYLVERWEFQYEVFNQCTGTNDVSNLILSCKESTQLCTNYTKCNCLCLFHKSNMATECLCSPHVLQPSITYNSVVNNMQECKCYHKDNAGPLTCSCTQKISYEPLYDSILIVFQKEETINRKLIKQYLKKYWEYKHEDFSHCKGSNSKSSLTLTCSKSTQTCMTNNTCNCLCVFQSKHVECLCSTHILLSDITYNTALNNLQECICAQKSNDKELTCKCKKKESFEPKYELMLMEFEEVTIHISIILRYLEESWEFKHEEFNSCSGISLKPHLSVVCTKPTSMCKKIHCNCLCILNEAASETECLCSDHVLQPNITYSTKLNNVQNCKCHHNGKGKGHNLICNCVEKLSFEPNYDHILIEWNQIKIDITIILTYLRQRWEFQYEVYNVCKGTSLSSPLTLTCTENTKEYTGNKDSNCLCIFNQNNSTTECVCSSHVLLPNITYSNSLNNLQGCTCHYLGNDKQLTCNCAKKVSFDPKYNNILIDLRKVTIHITIIKQYLQQNWEFKYEVFNVCNTNKLESPLVLHCENKVEQYTGKNPSNCLCIMNHAKKASECLCSPHVLLPNITYNTVVNDLQQCECVHQKVTKDNGKHLICECVKKPSFEPRYDLILIEWLEVQIDITIILTYFEERWEFQHEVFTLCNGTVSKPSLTLACTPNTQKCTDKNNCNCLCIVHQNPSTVECLCSPNVLLPNITYSNTTNDLQECRCFYKSGSKDLTCNCDKKISFNPNYNILIELGQERIEIKIILTYLQQRWEFQYESFNLCSGTSLSSRFNCTENTKTCTKEKNCNCLCIVNEGTGATECLCSHHVLLPNITYSTTLNNLQECSCLQVDNSNQMTCNCVKKTSFEPRYDFMLIDFHSITIRIDIVLTYIQQRWEFKHEEFRHCKGTNEKSSLTITCMEDTKSCTGKNHCDCLCVFHPTSNTVECLCSTHILLPNITYSTSENNLQGCACLNNNKDNQMTCQCTRKPSFEPKYQSILIELYQIKVHIKVILQYLEQRWEFQHEVFNLCAGIGLNLPLTVNCTNKIDECTKTNQCNCLCVLDKATTATECLCSPHVLLPNITYNTEVNDLQGCSCFHTKSTNQLTCNCVEKLPFEPKYDLILMEFLEVKIQINIIVTYLQQRWEFQHEVFNLCSGKTSQQLTCTNEAKVCTEKNKCNCLCVFQSNAIECVCSTHILLPNITYNATLNNIQGCMCFNTGKIDQINCNCVKKPSFEPKYTSILIDWEYVRIDITIIINYLQQRWEYQYEVFNQCNGTNLKADLELKCNYKTELCTEKNRCNCLCVFSQSKSATECLCSTHILLPNITYTTTQNNLQGCTCINEGKNNYQLLCKCAKKPSFEPRYDLILIGPYVNVEITIILTYLQQRWEFQHEIFNLCSGTSLKSPLTLMCTQNTETCTKNNSCNCLCLFKHKTSASECLCSPHVLLPNITYVATTTDIQACSCVYKSDTKYVTCNCDKKPTFDPNYNILIEWDQEKIDITIILTYLQQRWEFQYETFNICKGTSLTTSFDCTENTKACTEKDQCNCLCAVYESGSTECLCSAHVLLPNMTYSIDNNNFHDCTCFQKGNTKQMTCNCVKKVSFEPRYELMLIEVVEVKINIKIIITYFQQRWEFRHEVFNHCTGSSSNEAALLLTCDDKTEKCTDKKNCNCLCEFQSTTVDCYCSPYVLLPNITYSTTSIDLRDCTCLNKDKPNHVSCHCAKKVSFEPKYEIILIEIHDVTIHINLILQYLEQRWEFQHEIFDRCAGTSLASSLTINCPNKTHTCTENNLCNCLCVFDHVTTTTECLCSPHVLLPNITYNTVQNDVKGCLCFYKDNNNVLTCNCEKKPSYDPEYNILIEWEEEYINITILLTYFQQRWEFQHEVFNLCKISGFEPPLLLTCTDKTELCKDKNQCNCLCIFDHVMNATDCLCSPNVLLPNITYNEAQIDLRECICHYESNTKQRICDCENKPVYNPSYDILVVWKEEHFSIESFLIYVKQMWEFQHEVFNVCNSSSLESSLTLSCTDTTQKCTEKNPCNCLCTFDHVTKTSECLCNSHILLLDITYNTTLHDLRGCECVNKNNKLSCNCEKKSSFEPRYDFLINWDRKQIDIIIILEYFEDIWEFRHEIFTVCKSTSLKPSLTLGCTEKTEMCTEKDYCNCLCLFDHSTGATDCLCGAHVLLPNITYSNNYDLQKCKCIHKIGTNELTCNCEQKPSFNPKYEILIELQQEVIDITYILVYLQQRWEFQYEVFNLCNGTGFLLSCTEETDMYTINDTCDCLCVFHQATNMRECLCSTHVLLPNITYNTAQNTVEQCYCFQKGNINDLTCNCANKTSFEPNYSLILLEFEEVTINIKIILTYLQHKWEFQHEVFNQCKGTTSESGLALTCGDKTQSCIENKPCNCLCVFDREVECLCSTHILLSNITYTSTNNNLQGCICINKGDANQMNCNCEKKPSFEPQYNLLLLDLSQVTLHINIILQYLEQRWEFQYEVYNLCNGNDLKLPLTVTCITKTYECSESNRCNCLCLLDHANDAVECLCSPHVLLPNITYSITQYDLQGCVCFFKSNTNQLTCECEKKQTFDPDYDHILIEWLDIQIDTTIIMTYLQQRWEFQHEVINICKGTSLKSPLTLTCNDNTEACTGKNHCNCLCIFHQNTSLTECLCSPHILLLNITYSTTINDLQGCNCIYDGDVNQLTCNCEKKQSFNPKYNILIELYEVRIDITIITTYLEQSWEFKYESFTKCSGTTPLLISCEENTELYVGTNYRNCLCIKNTNDVQCLCSPNVLKLNIKYSPTMNDIQRCQCLHTGKTNELTCKCDKILSFEPNFDLIRIELLQIQIDISVIRTYLLQRWEFQYDDFNECSGVNLNETLILNCAQKTEVYSGYNRCNCLCVFYHATSTTECLCSPHATLVTFTYNSTLNDIEECSCQNEGNSYQLACNCKKKISFEPKYDFILFDAKQVTLTVEFIQKFFIRRKEFKFETFNQISCENSKLPLSCTWTDKEAISNKEVSYNCLCILSAFSSKAANCLCNKHILIPDIKYNTNQNKLQSCVCRNSLQKLDQLACECTPKESYNPIYSEVEMNLGSQSSVSITVILEYLKITRAFRYEPLNKCSCAKEGPMVSCKCQNDVRSYTIQSPADCICTWLNDDSQMAQCICNDHILDVKYTFTSSYLKLANCVCHNTGRSSYSLVGECEEMASVDQRYVNYMVHVPQNYNEIKNLAEFISTNFKTRDKFFETCTNQDYRACLYNVSSNKKPEPCLCLTSKSEHNNGCAYSLYLVQPMIFYDNSKYQLYRCYFVDTQWHCQLINDVLPPQQDESHEGIENEVRHDTEVQNVTKYIQFWNVTTSPQLVNHTIVRNVTTYITNTTRYITNTTFENGTGDVQFKNYTIVRNITKYENKSK